VNQLSSRVDEVKASNWVFGVPTNSATNGCLKIGLA